MTEGHDETLEPRCIRTCSVRTPDGDIVAAFAIDERRYTDPREVDRIYDEAWDEMTLRRVPCEWESWIADPAEPSLTLPSWEEYRSAVDEMHPRPDGAA